MGLVQDKELWAGKEKPQSVELGFYTSQNRKDSPGKRHKDGVQNTGNQAAYVFGDMGNKTYKQGKGSPVFCDYLIAVRPAMWMTPTDDMIID